MALTTTKLSGTITASAQQITLAAFTEPRTTFGAEAMLKFDTGEVCKIVDASLTPTLSVVRGYFGTLAVAHTTNAGVTYGLMSDAAWPLVPQTIVPTTPISRMNAQEVTATGATGTDAAAIIASPPAFLNATGVSGTGFNLPIPAVGDFYSFRNNGTGVIKIYCVGGTINGTTGTTAVSVTATGDLGGIAQCATAGAWYIAPMPT